MYDYDFPYVYDQIYVFFSSSCCCDCSSIAIIFLFITAHVLMIGAAVAIELCAGCSNRCFAYDFSYACLPLDIFIIYLVAAPRIVAIPGDGAGLWGGKRER